MKHVGIVGICLLAMAAPAAGLALQPPAPGAEDSNEAEQAADPASEGSAAEAAPAASDPDTDYTDNIRTSEAGFNCRPKGTSGRKYGPIPLTSVVTNAPAGSPDTGAFGDVPPPPPLPPC